MKNDITELKKFVELVTLRNLQGSSKKQYCAISVNKGKDFDFSQILEFNSDNISYRFVDIKKSVKNYY